MAQFRRIIIWACWALLGSGALVYGSEPGLAGRWRLDPARSTALDGWSTAELVVTIDGPRVQIRHDMTWRSTKVNAVNTLDTARPADLPDYFRIDQRHMAVYAPSGKTSHVTATWIDAGRTLKVEALIPVEVSQGDATLRTYSEYRLMEGGDALMLIELQNSRPRPLVYHFTRVKEEGKKL